MPRRHFAREDYGAQSCNEDGWPHQLDGGPILVGMPRTTLHTGLPDHGGNAEINSSYAAYDQRPINEEDAWGDLCSTR